MTKIEFWRPFDLATFSVAALLTAFAVPGQAAQDVALITALDGGVARVAEQGPQALQNFVKLKEGDVLSLDKTARLQIVYFDGGRQETWGGAGKIEVARMESKPTGLAAPQIKQLPTIMVKQIARTPALDTHGRGGVTRLRAIPTPEKIASVEKAYDKMRSEAAADDLTPEFYRLSSYFDMREIDRVERILADLRQSRPADAQVILLVSLYREAIFRAQSPAR